jgi:hypothetical protein
LRAIEPKLTKFQDGEDRIKSARQNEAVYNITRPKINPNIMRITFSQMFLK